MRESALPFPITAIETPGDLLAVAERLLEGANNVSSAERSLLNEAAQPVDAMLLKETIHAIRKGDDPLGEAYSRMFPPAARRDSGITLTPLAVVQRVIEAGAAVQPCPALIVDCGAGSGRFTIVAARRFPRARVIACELNPSLALLCRASVRVLGLERRVTIHVGDFRELEPPKTAAGRTLFLGNPPYVRHHDIPARWKQWYQAGMAAYNASGSQLAGLHFHFYLRVCQLAVDGDAGCFVTSAEWLDTNYGGTLRELLLGRLGGRAIFQYSASSRVFADALTTAAITSFSVGTAVETLSFSHEEFPGRSRQVPAAALRGNTGWSGHARPALRRASAATMQLGHYFRIHRGQVTGDNRLWIESEETPPLPSSVLFPAVTHARELTGLGGPLRDAAGLRRVIDLPEDLAACPKSERGAIDRFIEWAQARGAMDSYVALHRKPWWRVNLKSPPPVIMTYMGRRPPVFVRNLADARLLNIAHGLYPLQPIEPRALDALVAWLNANVGLGAGRTYAGGLVKFEPGEAMRIPVPPLDYFRHVA